MAEDFTTNPAAGGLSFRALFDASSRQWPAGLSAYVVTNGAGAASTLSFVTPTAGLPVQPQTGAAFPVTDNGGSLTVDGTVAAAQSGTWAVRAQDGAGNAVGSTNLAAGAPFASGTGFLAAAAGYMYDVPTGKWVRVSSDGAGALSVSVSAGQVNVGNTVAVIGNTAHDQPADGLPFAAAGRASAAAPAAVSADGDVVYLWADRNGRLQVGDGGATLSVDDGAGSLTVDGTVAATQSGVWTVTGAGGTFPVTDSGGSLTVDNGGTFAVQESGAALTALQLIDNLVLAEDAAHASGDPGVQMLAVRQAAPANLSGLAGDYEPLQVNAGRLWCSATVDAALPAGTNNIGDVDVLTLPANATVNLNQVAGTGTATGNGVASAGCQRVTVASDNTAFPVNSVQSGTWTVQPGNTANTTPWLVTDTPATSGGLSISRVISAATTNSTSVKGSAGQVYAVYATNVNAAVRYLKLYNKATGPTVGTDTPVLTFAIPGNAAGAGFALNVDKGIAFGTGIGLALTTGVADADTGAVAANEIVVNVLYK